MSDTVLPYQSPSALAAQAATPIASGRPLLEVRDLRTHFAIRRGVLSRTVGHVKAVDGVSFDVFPSKTLGPGRRVRLR